MRWKEELSHGRHKLDNQPVFGDNYRLTWRKVGEKQVGEVRNYATDGKGYRRVVILLDDELIKKNKMRFLMISWDASGPKIYVSSLFLAIPQRLRAAGIWHEIGHVHYEHPLRSAFHSQVQLRTARMLAIKKRQVMPIEEEADRFAVDRAGKGAVIDFLNYVLATRPTGGNLAWNEMGRKELEIRIAAIQDYGSEE
jgi:hypothetical protein